MTFTILCVIPYSGMRNLIQLCIKNVKSRFSGLNVKINIQEANLTNKEAILLLLEKNKYDLIISRGGTAEYIRKLINKPVIDISFSQYDLIRTIKTIEETKNTAIIAYKAIADKVLATLDEFNLKIKVSTVSNEKEIKNSLMHLYSLGFRNIICDSGTVLNQNIYHMNTFLITSGEESVYRAIRESFTILNSIKKDKSLNSFLLSFSQIYADAIGIFNNRGKYLSSIELNSNITIRPVVYKKFYKQKQRLTKINNKYYKIEEIQNNEFSFLVLKEIKQNGNIKASKNNNTYISHIFANSYSEKFFNLLDNYAQDIEPIAIIGESGMFRDYLYSYISSKIYNNKYEKTFINLSTVQKLKNEINNYASPLYDNNQTIIIKNWESSSIDTHHLFLRFLKKTKLLNRCKLVFSIIKSENQTTNFFNDFPYLIHKIYLKPVRKFKYKVIKNIVKSIINEYDVKIGKNIISISAPALDLLCSYDWPNNYQELLSTILQSLSIAEKSILDSNSVETILNQVRINDRNNLSNKEKNTSEFQTLQKVQMNYIQKILKITNGNKTETAKILGISRATLWRYLK